MDKKQDNLLRFNCVKNSVSWSVVSETVQLINWHLQLAVHRQRQLDAVDSFDSSAFSVNSAPTQKGTPGVLF